MTEPTPAAFPEPVHDHELEVLETDENVPPRPEETIADAGRTDEVKHAGRLNGDPVAGEDPAE
jgi:hypothetical protein